jgi:hypothetical protein
LFCAVQEGIQLVMDKYPETMKVDLGVAAMGVESPEGTFIRTGAELHHLPSSTDLAGESCICLCVREEGCPSHLSAAAILI